MHYAVPSILEEDHKLLYLYNDFNALSFPGWLGSATAYIPSKGLHRLLQRRPSQIPKNKIVSSLSVAMRLHLRRQTSATFEDVVRAEINATKAFAQVALRHGIAQADASFTYDRAGLEIMQAIKANGGITVMEQTVAPAAKFIDVLSQEKSVMMKGEERGWQLLGARERQEWELADLILCGSDFVRDSIISEGANAEKSVVVPYGVDPSNYNLRVRRYTSDRPLRMLSVGEVGFRKGANYMIEAARKLGDQVEIKMIGSIRKEEIDTTSLPKNITLVGRVPREAVAQWYDWADIFILPSLFEGSATVTYEAMASGLPVICTQETGSIVIHDRSGLIIPSCSSEAIVEAVRSVTNERLNAWSDFILHTEHRWDMHHYKENFLAAIGGVGL